MKIEFAILRSNHTWDTVIEDVPFTEDTQLTDIEEWANIHLAHKYDAEIVTIYNDSPED